VFSGGFGPAAGTPLEPATGPVDEASAVTSAKTSATIADNTISTRR
jgi:hypothetical protein